MQFWITEKKICPHKLNIEKPIILQTLKRKNHKVQKAKTEIKTHVKISLNRKTKSFISLPPLRTPLSRTHTYAHPTFSYIMTFLFFLV